ncbi:anti-sigma factor domain-containing protein [Aeromicrobium sp.]|uniref:anti-sigma factor n=1 Tax=Aeromicrobium sp. TaxID=1871063 RepID=UPI0035174850
MTHDLHTLAAPYALDALDPHERARFEGHLDQCAECRQELRGFHLTALRLAEAEADTPPPALRARLLAEVSATAQERPVVTTLAQRGRIRRAGPRLLVAASVLVAAGAIGGYVSEHQRADSLQADSARISSVMVAGDATMLDGKVRTGGTMRVVASPSHDAAVVMGSDLEPLDDGHVYQVWAMHDGVPRSLGVLGSGAGMIYAQDIAGSDAFAVTVEPDGGSPAPTTDPVAAMPV